MRFHGFDIETMALHTKTVRKLVKHQRRNLTKAFCTSNAYLKNELETLKHLERQVFGMAFKTPQDFFDAFNDTRLMLKLAHIEPYVFAMAQNDTNVATVYDAMISWGAFPAFFMISDNDNQAIDDLWVDAARLTGFQVSHRNLPRLYCSYVVNEGKTIEQIEAKPFPRVKVDLGQFTPREKDLTHPKTHAHIVHIAERQGLIRGAHMIDIDNIVIADYGPTRPGFILSPRGARSLSKGIAKLGLTLRPFTEEVYTATFQ